jgi:hypothetical protein
MLLTHVDLTEKLLAYNTLERSKARGRGPATDTVQRLASGRHDSVASQGRAFCADYCNMQCPGDIV